MFTQSNHLSSLEKMQQAYNSNPLSNRERIAKNKYPGLSSREIVKTVVLQPSNSKSFFPQRAPILCSEYMGISSDSRNFLSSDRITHSSEIFHSSSDMVHSSDQFRSSDAILEYLKHHPDFQKVSPRQFSPIVATILSSLAIGLGVVMVVVSHITGSPVLSLATSLVLGSGIAGLTEGISGIRHNTFEWEHFGTHIAMNSVKVLLTFGSGCAVGGITGLALTGRGLTASIVKAIGSVAGGLVGSGVRGGSYIVLTKTIEGEPITAFSLMINMASGALRGESAAGYLNVHVDHAVSSLALGAEKVSSHLGNEIVKVHEYSKTS